VALNKAAKIALFAPQTSKVFLTLLTIDHADLGAPLRFVNDNVDVTSNGDLYSAFPFEVILPPERADELTVGRLRIDNIDRGITSTLRSISTAPSAAIQVVLSSDPDTVQLGPLNFTWRIADYDVSTVEGDLRFEELLGEPFPGDRVTPNTFPGVF